MSKKRLGSADRKYNYVIIHIQSGNGERGKAPTADRGKLPTVDTLADLQQMTYHNLYYV